MLRKKMFSKFLQKKINCGDKILLVSHNDLDGYGPEIILKASFYNVDTLHVSNGAMDKTILWATLNEQNDKYDYIIITDISCSAESAKKIAASKNAKKVILLDHHISADYLNDFDFAVVAHESPDDSFSSQYYPENIKMLPSGTTLLLDFLYTLDDEYHTMLTGIYSCLLCELCFTIGIYDTWDWVNVFNKKRSASDLNKLFYILGEEDFINTYVDRLESEKNNLFSDEDEKLLNREEKKCNNYIEKKAMIIKVINHSIANKNYKICICRAERYTSELFEYMKEKYPTVDFYLIDSGNSLSLRSINDVNVSEIAKLFGGGGHAQAAGVSYSQEKSIDFIRTILS